MKFLYPVILALIASVSTARALDTGFYAPSSRLSEGRWVKIRVDSTGMQQLTAAHLAAMGFNDPAAVHVYGYGGLLGCDHALDGTVPDDLPPVPSVLEGDKVIFYGESGRRDDCIVTGNVLRATTVINQASRYGYYFLHEESAPRVTPETQLNTRSAADISTHLSVDVADFNVSNPAESGVNYFTPNFAHAEKKSFTHVMIHDRMVPDSVCYHYYSAAMHGEYNRIVVYVNDAHTSYGTNLSDNTGQNVYYGVMQKDWSSKYSTIPTDGYFRITLDFSSSRNITYAAIDKITSVYCRYNYMDGATQRTLHYRQLPAGARIVMADGPATTRLWNVTQSNAPVILGDGVTGKTSGMQRLIAFDPASQLYTPVPVETVTPNSNLHAMEVPSTIILTPLMLIDGARQLAALHAGQLGIESRAVIIDEVYNEFGSGTPSVDAIRRFIKMLHDRGNGKLRNVVILGASNWDFIGYTSDQHNHLGQIIPSLQVEVPEYQAVEASSYASDAFYGMVADSPAPTAETLLRTPMLVNVGRIPALTNTQLTDYINKASLYLTSLRNPASAGRAMIISDYGDSNGHLRQCETANDTIKKNSPSLQVTKQYSSFFIDRSADTRLMKLGLYAAFNDGLQYVSYSGHGNYNAVGPMTRTEIKSMRNRSFPFTMLATCYSLPMDREITGVGEELLMSPAGGSIAVVGAGRSVQMSYNQHLNLAIARNAHTATAGHSTLGDIFRAAHNEVATPVAPANRILNTFCYNLAGDPSLPAVFFNSAIGLDPLQAPLQQAATNNITGRVLDDAGETDASFNGLVFISICNPDTTVTTLENNSEDPVLNIDTDGSFITGTTVEVKEGRFSCPLACPMLPLVNSDKVTLRAVAVDNAGRRHAIAHPLEASVAVSETIEPSGTAPSITGLAIVTDDFDGRLLRSSSAMLNATITDGGAPLSISSDIVCGIRVLLDGKRLSNATHAVTDNLDGTYTLDYQLNDLSDGNHTITLSVSDLTGERAEASTSFTVVNAPVSAALIVDNAIARDEVIIDIEHDFRNEPVGRLVIRDIHGRAVQSVDNPSFPYIWNLTGLDDKPVDDGRYTIHAYLRDGNSHAVPPHASVIIIK